MPGARKYIEVLIFVVLWMAAGWVFHLDTIAYLLFGVPLVVLFQLFISRRSLWNLWVRDATTFRLSLIGIVLQRFSSSLLDTICSLTRYRRSRGWLSYGSCSLWPAPCLRLLRSVGSVQAPLVKVCQVSSQRCSLASAIYP